MVLGNWIDPRRCYELLSGIIGIYVIYLGHGLLQESILKEKYINNFTDQKQQFIWPSGTLLFPCGFTWILGAIINHFTIPAEERVSIPNRKSAICGLTVSTSTLTYTYAIYLTNFPVVMMFKSFGILCSRVTDKKLKLGTKKLVVGVVITIGIILFKAFDPQAAKKQEKKTQILGIVLLIVSLLADGFLPDFQAQIKAVLKPKPMEMLVEINKWVTIISFLYSCCLLQIYDMIKFVVQHQQFAFHMFLFSVCTLLGQMFVYRMIKQFKQHFVPFVITTRKIFTVGLSIIWYRHETNMWQLTGLALVFSLVTFEFISELVEEKQRQAIEAKEENKETTELSLDLKDVSPRSPDDEKSEEMTPEQIQSKEKEEYAKRITPNETTVSKQAMAGELIQTDDKPLEEKA